MRYLSDLFIEYFRIYNIYFLAISIILKSIGFPTGSTLVVIVAGAFAYFGDFNITVLFLEVWFFSCIGDLIGYFTWGFIGNVILTRFSILKRYFEPKISKSELYLEKHGMYLIFYSRFLLSSISPFVNAACGILKYKLFTFNLYVILGNFLWTGIFLGLGYWFSSYWKQLVTVVTIASESLTFVVALTIIIYLIIKTNKKSKSL